MEQRLVGLSYTVGSGVLNVTSPPNGNIAPPGYYMLFVLNTAGVPSVARFVRLTASPPNQPPVATIISPAANVTRNPGGTVSFSGTGSDPDGTISAYAWTFPGGAPASSSVASPGNVTYSTPGSYVASFQVTDNQGLASQPVTRTVTVSNFSLTATPATATVAPGGSTSYTANVVPANGFTGTVTFSVTRASLRRDGRIHSGVGDDVRVDDAERVDERGNPAGQLSADDSRDQWTGHSDCQRDAGRRRREWGLHDRGDAGKPDDRQGRRRDLHRDDHGRTLDSRAR